MSNLDTQCLMDQPHRRLNLLTGKWILVSPHRATRPWQGEIAPLSSPGLRPRHDPDCYLCPGSLRANGYRNPSYTQAFVFDNDFPALLGGTAETAQSSDDLLRADVAAGVCRVICYSPRHDLTLAEMSPQEIRQVIELWADQHEQLATRWRWVQIFENKGDMMGCSNPHPHGQIWASDFVPNEAANELAQQVGWRRDHASKLLLHYASVEAERAERVVLKNDHWIALVPWWAVWPFETLLIPLHSAAHWQDLDHQSRGALTQILSRLLASYDRLFGVSMPYSFGWHAAPSGPNMSRKDADSWQLHAHFYPPLLRSATVRKFMVGYELLAEAQRDITPESAAGRLRECVS